MKIALLDDYQGVALACADWNAILPGADVTAFRDTLTDRDALVARLQDFEIIGIMRERTPFPRALLERLPKLKLLVTTGHRNDSIDLAAAKERGIAVCGTPSSGHAAAELTWALIMAAARRIDLETQSFRDGGWQVGLGRDLNGATLGIIGLGRLGSLVAGYGKAFGMNAIAWSQNLTAEKAAAQGGTAVSKEAPFRAADFITTHLRPRDRSRGPVNAEELPLINPDARHHRARPPRQPGRRLGQGLRHERDRLEPEPDRREGGRPGRHGRQQGGAVPRGRLHHHPPAPQRPLARAGERRDAGTDEAGRLDRQHLARPDHRRGGAARGPEGQAHRRRRA